MVTSQFNSVITYCDDGVTYSQWHIGDQSYEFAPITHLCTNPFEELLTACDDLLEGKSGLIYWFHEPRITKITLSLLPDDENLLISIYPFPEMTQASLKGVAESAPFTFKTNVQQFLLVIFYEMQKIISLRETMPQYLKEKSPAFPYRLFHQFKDRLNRRIRAVNMQQHYTLIN